MPSFISKCTTHLDSIDETYTEHARFAIRSGLRMIVAGIACVLHGLIPALFEATGSRTVRELDRIFAYRSAAAKRDLAARDLRHRAA